MKKRVMVTTLFDCERAINKAYFFSKGDNGKTLYCDAMMPVEAACKFVLATYPIDEIIVIDYENEDKPSRDSGAMVLREGKTFFSSDLKTLSDFDLLRYRLAEYVEEVYAEDQDDNALITGEEQKKAIAFLRRFFSGRIREQPDNRMNRYFHILAQDYSLQTALDEELRTWAPEWEYERYKTWVCHYLYQRLKETGKMELLEGNRDVRIRLVSVNRDESFMLAEYMPGKGLTIEGSDGEDGTELLLFIENADAAEVLDVFNIINMTKVIPSNRFNINRMFTATNYSHLLANVIMDRTKVLSISELLSGASAFMNYGKTGSIVKYWKQCGVENTKIDQMIYAMRNIDTGISLCDINDIERGIKSLRSVIEDREPIGGDTTVEHFFAIFLQEGIRKDYGRLLETDEIQFIDLVRWA